MSLPDLEELLSWLIPLGFFGAMIFPAILAHWSYRCRGTWLLLVGAILFLVTTLFNNLLTPTLAPLYMPTHRNFYEIYLYTAFFMLALSFLIYSLGVLSLGRNWKALSHRAAALELEVETLANQANGTNE